MPQRVARNLSALKLGVSSMPNYIYECQKCGKKLEVTQKISENALTEVKHNYKVEAGMSTLDKPCNGKVKRIIVGCNFILKGGGWTKPRTASQKKVDASLKQMGVDDESAGWEVGE